MGNIKYFLCYDVMLCFGTNLHTRRQGKQETADPYDREMSLRIAERLNEMYGADTHWIEDEDGERITADET